MTTICHLVDRSAGWEQRVGVSQLLDRLPADRFATHIASIDGAARAVLASTRCRIDVLPHLP
ncbi:MAG: hypothetical protein PVI86_03890, partial [Phycisphaerae bacterium]